MKRPGVSLVVPPAMLFVLTGLHAAQPAAPAETKAPPAPTAIASVERAAESTTPMRAMAADDILKRFDKNGDGKLDDDERADAHEAMLKEQMNRSSATPARQEQFRKRMLEMFDRNHDGQLDPEERAAARKYAEEHGLEPGSAVRQELLQRFDRNGDGKLDDAERAEMQKYLQSRGGKGAAGAGMRQEILRRYDKNGDGKIDDAEWNELSPALRELIANAPEQLRRYDKNGDGKLDDQEWAAATAQIRHFLDEPPQAAKAASDTPKASTVK